MKRYAIVVEKAGSNFAAYVPDLPGCVATGETVEATERRLRQAIEVHGPVPRRSIYSTEAPRLILSRLPWIVRRLSQLITPASKPWTVI